jgi:uncharacterized protein
VLIDAHVHLLAERNRLDPPDAFRKEGDILYAEMSTEWSRAVWQRACWEQLELTMKQVGIDAALAFGFPWRSPDRCRADNDYVAACVERAEGRVKGLAVFQPTEGKNAVAEVVERLESGRFLGVKLKAQWQGHSLADSKLWSPVLREVMERNGVALVHVEQSTKPPRGNGPSEFLDFLRAFPDLKVIGAHFGAMTGLYHTHQPELFQNTVFDTALGTAATVTSAYLAVGLEDKLVFGSDFPGMSPEKLWLEMTDRLVDQVHELGAGNLLRFLGEDAFGSANLPLSKESRLNGPNP